MCLYGLYMAFITAEILGARSGDLIVCICMYVFYGAYNYSSLVRQASAYSNVAFSTAGFTSGEKPRPKTRETTALRRGI